jgi:hypothetical protein
MRSNSKSYGTAQAFGRYLKIVFSIMIVLSTMGLTNSYSQTDCNETLNQARRFYQAGQIEKVPKVLDECMSKGFTKSQKTEAYQLLVLTYQYDNKP